METCRSKFGSKVDSYRFVMEQSFEIQSSVKVLGRQMVLENDVDGEILMEMSDENLLALGISSFGHRSVIVLYV